ncbi:hypothetical protein HOD82_01335 [bacterium]|nr:hypothetical protein [bacterium]MBT4597839.1 hypothetical protein [bacterium]
MFFRSFIILTLVFFFQTSFPSFAFAKENVEETKVDYKKEVIIDSDLDGLTDEGEKQIFKTDPSSSDTDKDGFFDGAEILNGTDPLDRVDPVGRGIMNLTEEYFVEKTPWAWYLSRASGFLAYIFLWLSIFYGLAIRNIFLRKTINPANSLRLHSLTSVSAVFWALFHGVSFLFHDAEYAMGIKDVFIPFYSENIFVNRGYLTLGVIAFYILVVIVLTSFIKDKISHKIWRVAHSLNLFLVPLLALHVIFLGTDMQNQVVKLSFIVSLLLLVPLYSSSLVPFLWKKIKKR